MSQDFYAASAYVAALTGNPETPMDWRLIHDRERGVPGHNFHGTLTQVWPTLLDYQSRGYGVFLSINAMDGQGRDLNNVAFVRAHVADLDNTLTSAASYHRAVSAHPTPHFAVQTSPEKYHIYWLSEPYRDNDFFTLMQRKLIQLYDADKKIIDASRVMRVPGFFHLKGDPFLITSWQISNTPRISPQTLHDALASVNVIQHVGSRKPLGDPEMAAPSLDWLKFSLTLQDPNELDYGEWVSFTAAFKQAGWSLAEEGHLYQIWSEWCARYEGGTPQENLKIWNSLRDTEVGWKAITRRTTVGAYLNFGYTSPSQISQPAPQQQIVPVQPAQQVQPSVLSEPKMEDFGEMLNELECRHWFKDCFFVESMGKIYSNGRFMNSTQFNGRFGGKMFILGTNAKTSNEAWAAALRSTLWTIPKVDHIRFLPTEKPFSIVFDEMGRKGLNTYVPANVKTVPGDVTPWLIHVAKILPEPDDQRILFSYLAHCVKFPGHKIRWAPLIQGLEGAGKGVFFDVMQNALGSMYIYSPKAQELVKSGSTFNAWMRSKLLIMVNEIKVDERRELVEILKPMITDRRVEVQSKGVDQEMEDNVANWLFFSNFPDAIPITANGRRYAIFYSAVQTPSDLYAAGMDDKYFIDLFRWLEKDDGFAKITYWLKNYPIEEGGLPVRAPKTSSYTEALKRTRTPLQIVIEESIEDNLQGFRGGYVSVPAVMNKARAAGVRSVTANVVQQVLEQTGYKQLGKAPVIYMNEDHTGRPMIFANSSSLVLENYGKAQGYDV